MKQLWYRFALAFGPGSRLPRLAPLTLALFAAVALAQSGADLTQSLSAWFCPAIQFLAGPVVWGVIFVAFLVGVAMLAAGGRGAIRLTLVAFVAAIVLLVGKSWITSQMSAGNQNLNSAVKTCLGQ